MAGSRVGVGMGSSSDRETMRHRADLAEEILAEPDASVG